MVLTKRQHQIVEASLALIAEKGIQHLTIKSLAAGLGISEPAIYRHFKNKFAILDTVLESFRSDSQTVLKKMQKLRQSPLDSIGVFFCDRLRRMTQSPNLAKVMFSEELFQDDPRLAAKMLSIMHEHKKMLEEHILEAQKTNLIRGDIEMQTLFRLIFGPLRLIIKQWALCNHQFDLESEGLKLWEAQKKLLS